MSNVSTLTSYYSNWAITHHHLWTIYPGCELQHWGADNLYQFKCSVAHVWPSKENSICPTSRVGKDAKAAWLLPFTLEVSVSHCSFVQRLMARPMRSPHRSMQMDNKEALKCGHSSFPTASGSQCAHHLMCNTTQNVSMKHRINLEKTYCICTKTPVKSKKKFLGSCSPDVGCHWQFAAETEFSIYQQGCWYSHYKIL